MIRRILTRRAATIIASLGVAITVSAVAPASARAVEWRASCGDEDFVNFAFWQSSKNWARASERSCLRWTSDGTAVQFITQFKLDWPKKCSVTYPKKGTCPDGRLAKTSALAFRQVRVGVGWSLPDGRKGDGECQWGSMVVRPAGDPEYVFTCNGPKYSTVPLGDYKSTVAVVADLADDSDDALELPASTAVITLTNE